MFVFNSLYFEVRGDQATEVFVRCRDESGFTPGTLPPGAGLRELTAQAEASEAFYRCTADEDRINAAFIAVGLAALGGLTAGGYLLTPAWKVRRRGLMPLAAEQHPELSAFVDGLVEEAGLKTAPRLFVAATDGSISAHAFGWSRSKSIAVSMGLVVLFTSNRSAFTAVVRHELAHIRNRDIGITYVTVTLWWAFVVAGVVPILAITVGDLNSRTLALAWRMAFLALLVLSVRNWVLRTREHYADLRAAECGGDELADAIREWGHRPPVGGVGYHPSLTHRLRVLRDPGEVLRFRAAAGAIVGVVAAISLANFNILLSLIGSLPVTPDWGSAILVLPLVAGFIVASVIGHVASVGKASLPWGLAAGLGVGLVLGLMFGELASLEGAITGSVLLNKSPVSFAIWWAASTAVSVAGLALWVASLTRWWVAAPRNHVTAKQWWLGFGALASFVFVVWVGMLFVLRIVGPHVGTLISVAETSYAMTSAEFGIGPFWFWRLTQGAIPVFITGSWWVLSAAVILWATPLLAWLTTSSSDKSPLALSPGVAARFALIHTGIFAVLLIGFRFAIRASTELTARDGSDAFALAWFNWQLVVLVVVAGLASVWTASQVERLPIAHALAAAAAVAVLGSMVMFLTVDLEDCIPTASVLSKEGCSVSLGFIIDPRFMRWFVLLSVPVAVLGGLIGGAARGPRGLASGLWARAGVSAVVGGLVVAAATMAMAGTPADSEPRAHETSASIPDAPLILVDPAQRSSLFELLEFSGVEPAGSQDEQISRAVIYCSALEAGESLEKILVTMPSEDLEAEVALLSAATIVLCPDFVHLDL